MAPQIYDKYHFMKHAMQNIVLIGTVTVSRNLYSCLYKVQYIQKVHT